jgi:hypothetical protein
MGLTSVVCVSFAEYQTLTFKFNNVFTRKLLVSLKNQDVHSVSIKFLVMNLQQLEFIRILEGKHSWKMTPDIIEEVIDLISGGYGPRHCPDNVLK